MSDDEKQQRTEKTSRLRRATLWWPAVVGLALLLMFVAAGLYLSSRTFHEQLRRAVVSELERRTGGRVELRNLQWNLFDLDFEADGLTIHGTEPHGEAPFVRIGRLYARLKIVSMLSGQIGFRQLSISHPEIHLIVYPDGTTNQPTPRVKTAAARSPEGLFNFEIEHLELSNGLLLWNQERIPLDVTASDVEAAMKYSAGDKRYDGSIRAGKIDAKLKDYRPFAVQADAKFSIYPTRFTVNSLSVATSGIRMDANGDVEDFRKPQLDVTYKFGGELHELAGIARVPALRGGSFELSGRGTWSQQRLASFGKIAIRDVAWSDASLHLSNVSAGADYTVDNLGISLPHVFVHAFGGTLMGEARVRSTPTGTGAVFRAKEGRGERLINLARQDGTVDLAIRGLSVPRIMDAVSTQHLPLNKLNVVGTASGRFRANWKGTLRNLLADIALEINAPAAVPAGDVPLFGQVHASYREPSGTVNFDVLTLSTSATHLTASGAITPHDSLRFNLATSNPAEFGPLIRALGGPTLLPVHLSGVASISGSATGTLKAPTIRGHVEARDFTTMLAGNGPVEPSGAQTAAATAPAEKQDAAMPGAILKNPAYWQLPRWPLNITTPQKRDKKPAVAERHRVKDVHWDHLSADVFYSPRRAAISHFRLRHNATIITLDGSATLANGRFNDQTPFTASIGLQDGDVAEMQSIAGYDYPVTGTLDATLQVEGTRSAPEAGGHVTLSKAVIYGQNVHSLDADVRFGNNLAQAHDVRVVSDLGDVGGNVAYNVKTRAFQFAVRGKDLRVERLPQANDSRLHIAGLLTLDASGSGTPDAPVFNGAVQLRDLALNKVRVGKLTASAVTRGGEMTVTVGSDFPNGHVAANGTVHLRGDMAATGVVTFNSSNLNPLVEAFVPVKLTGPTVIDGRTDISGSLRSPGTLKLGVEVAKLSSSLEGIPLKNEGALRVSISNGVARIDQFRMVGEQTHYLELRGTAELGGERQLNMRADGDINLKILQTIDANLMADGVSAFRLTVGGTLAKPGFRGRVTITNGAVSYIDLPNGLSGVNGTMVFNQDRLQVERLTARSGGGLLELGGFMTYDRGITFNLTGHGRDIRIRYPEGVSSTADANLTLVGNMKNAMLSGSVTVTKFSLNPQFDFATYLQRSSQTAIMPGQASPANNLHLDVHVISTPSLQLQTSLARITGDFDLHIRGTAARPAVLGRVDILEGDVNFAGTKYQIERGDLTFSNPVRITPVLDVEATAHVRDYDISLGLHGPLDRLSMTYRSDPPLPTGDIIALLALGRTRDESINQPTIAYTQSQPTLTQSASSELLGQALNATVSSRAQKLFGVSRIKIDPSVGGPENAANARMTIEQQVSNKVTLTYITNLAQSAQEVIQVEYNINREISIIGVRDQNGVVGFDIRIRKRKR